VNDDELTRDLEDVKIIWSVEDLNRIPTGLGFISAKFLIPSQL